MKKQLNINAQLGRRMWSFSYDKTFVRARDIWIFCHENDLKVPKEVSKIFYEGIKKRHEDYKINNPYFDRYKPNKSNKEKLILYRYVRLWIHIQKYKRGSQAKALRNYEEILRKRGIDINFDVKKRYERAKKLKEEIDKSWEK